MAAGSLALYRKYRSATFGELIGQSHVTGPLIQALSSGRINHAYLFSGPRGCGKTSSARILARSINCAQGPTPEPCGVCDSCIELAPNGSGSIDVIEIDAASHGGVDDARDLRERAFYAPARDRYKVYVIDEAHMVSKEGFNALLKLVEEPPDFLIFIFATTEPDKVLPTIRSRTHHYPFRLVPPAVLRSHLERICEAEGVAAEPAVFPLVVRAGGGSVRDSLSILDQLLAGAGPDGLRYADAMALLGVTDAALLDDMVDALAAVDAAAVYGAVERVVDGGHDPRRFGADLLDRFRDLLVLDAVPDAAERGLIDVPADQLARMRVQSSALGGATLARFGEIVHAGLVEMRGTTSPRLLLELLCARMLVPDSATDAAAVMQRLERVERRMELSGAVSDGSARAASIASSAPAAPPAAPSRPAGPAAPAPASPPTPASSPTPASPAAPAADAVASAVASPSAASAPAPAGANPALASSAAAAMDPAAPAPAVPSVAPGQVDAAGLRSLWPEVLAAANRLKKRTGALLQSAAAQVHSVDGQAVVITANTPVLARMLSDASNLEVVSEALSQVLPGTWRVSVAAAGEAPARAGASRPPAPAASPPAAPSPAAPPSAASSPAAAPAVASSPAAQVSAQEAGSDAIAPASARPSAPQAGSGGAVPPSPATSPSQDRAQEAQRQGRPRPPASPSPAQGASRPATTQRPATAMTAAAPAEETPIAWPSAAIPGGHAALEDIPPGPEPDSDDDYDLTTPVERTMRDPGAEAMALLEAELGARPIDD